MGARTRGSIGAGRTVAWGMAAAVGTAALLLVTTIGVSGGSVGAPFTGSSWSPYGYREFQGCATSGMTNPSWSAKTGVGHMAGRTYASGCPPSRAAATSSSAEVVAELSVNVPLHLPTGKGGVNVSWNLSLGSRTAAGGGTTASCPVSYYNYTYNYGYTIYRLREMYRYCIEEAQASLAGDAYLVDQTTGTYQYGNYWGGATNLSGEFLENYSYSGTYSNRSYWSYNFSYNFSSNQSYGSVGALASSYQPTFFLNGSFSAGHRYLLQTYLEMNAYTAIQGYGPGAHAAARINLQTMGHSATLAPVQIW